MILYSLLSRSGSRITSLVLGLLLLGTGVYFLLRNAFGFVLPQIDWDLVWPVWVMLTGLAILSRVFASKSSQTLRPSSTQPTEGVTSHEG